MPTNPQSINFVFNVFELEPELIFVWQGRYAGMLNQILATADVIVQVREL